MKAMLDLVARHKTGQACGIYSVCSAHPLVIEAACVHALQGGVEVLLVEATCNQVNQDGGYTGMTPADFHAFLGRLAREEGVAPEKVLSGGDHLGPLTWQNLPEAQAMENAEELVRAYVLAGFS